MTCGIYRVIFFTDAQIVLIENYQSKDKAEKRITQYKGGYPVRLEICQNSSISNQKS